MEFNLDLYNCPQIALSKTQVFDQMRVFSVIPAKAGIQLLDASVRWHDKYLDGCDEGLY